ncbi:type I polyketide synthase [Boudabousia marimammalium]|uniref:Type I polyketide synthase n=1 Tax=Boudabousia marimammalium TaxID=156892 RepID=A0A1Q5PPA9_9ACTO|nr:type I polyketide synthase [Boudabousia marimammalium]OKL49280.1 type I polyketide synthase [Boudabousia marimammalium]
MTSALTSAPVTLVFSGQASDWKEELRESITDGTNLRLKALLQQAKARIAAVAAPVTMAVPAAPERLLALLSEEPAPSSELDRTGAVSVPAILLSQIAALWQLEAAGLPVSLPPTLGHSQGLLGARAASLIDDEEKLVDLLAFALLLGAAASVQVRELGGSPFASRLLSVRGLCDDAINAALEKLPSDSQGVAQVALKNGPQAFVFSGQPQSLALLRQQLTLGVQEHNAAIEAKLTGGTTINPRWDELPVAVPFHHPVLQPAVELTMAWAKVCGLTGVKLKELATQILVTPQDWPQAVQTATKKHPHLLMVGPGSSLARLTQKLVAGTPAVVIDAGSVRKRDELARIGAKFPKATDWSRHVPKLLTLPSGETVVETAFTRLTGNSPILLAGMTPTTVDPQIVAAAANAGFWAEMAGGGQYSAEVFTAHKNGLVEQLEPGRAAQFNSMYFDRFMWNLQFGVQKIVSKARSAGAPINGVTISAGIPEVAEASDLIASLKAEGFPYICFKPGTVEQIRSVLQIADANPHTPLVMQVEDGHAGGHHSWVDLDDLLSDTYADIRTRENVILCVGGGIGTPERAADYISGQWSLRHGLPLMPVDGILVGTAAMTVKEAKTSPQVKQLLKATPGVKLNDQGGWVGRGKSRGGVTSGLSHLHADMYEVDNASAACSRLLAEVGSEMSTINARRTEIIAALNRTAKPFFGEVKEMTYQQWAQRVLTLSFPWGDPTWQDRFWDLLQRIEARLHEVDHGPISTLFPTLEAVSDGPAALALLLENYPQAATTPVTATDAAWFVGWCRKHHKPMPFVPVIDADLSRWWGLDTLWQSQDERYDADTVRVIPGPVSVGGIDRVDEPVAELLGRFEAACVARLKAEGITPQKRFARLGSTTEISEYLRTVPHLVWNGHLIDNPARTLSAEACRLRETEAGWELAIIADTYWDDLPEPQPYTVREVTIPLDLPASVSTGAVPTVSHDRLPVAVYDLLAGVAGIGSVNVAGDKLTQLPQVHPDPKTPFGVVKDRITVTKNIWASHLSATGAVLSETEAGEELELPAALADALVGPCWPAIYAALGSAHLADGYPVIEGLLNAVHLDHCIDLEVPLTQLVHQHLLLDVTAQTQLLEESASGRIVTVNLELFADGTRIARLIERFAIRGRITTTEAASTVAGFGGQGRRIEMTPRAFTRRVTVSAPSDMTPFAIASGDYNPIHTSTNAAALVGLDAPLVHGMWLSAVAQTVLCGGTETGAPRQLHGWTYSMYGMVQLNDEIEILVERIGRTTGSEDAYEVTCRIGEKVVSRGQAVLAPLRTAYVYPGQGIQQVGMGAKDRQKSASVRNVWERADQHTRRQHGFSIIQVVDQNPTELRVNGQLLRHPDGVMNLTQFTQVALAVVAYGQTMRLQESHALVPNSVYAGHSLGEYTALASGAGIFDLEAVIDVVYSRGSAMHALVERDSEGRSNYRLGALRPNQCGISATEVENYVETLAQETGEFLQIVNFNLEGQQYAVAGTVAGLAALAEDASRKAQAHGGKRPFMLIPGIDVPFHSRALRAGVPAFAQKLDELLPSELDYQTLVNRYIPNLVARPFELSRDFAEAICAEVPSSVLEELLADGNQFEQLVANSPGAAARILVIELLSWQFASPVRWIETQALLFTDKSRGGLGIEEVVEVGLAQAPTLANLAAKTLKLPQFSQAHIQVKNVERDEAAVYATDTTPIPPRVSTVLEETQNEASDLDTEPAWETPSEPQSEQANPTNIPNTPSNNEPLPELTFGPSEALLTLFALQTKLLPDQITPIDTTDSLTNGVSSRRNQLLMDMSTELGVASIDGASEADLATLQTRVEIAAPGYAPYGPVLADVMRARLRTILAGAGLKANEVAERVTGTWGLPSSWIAPVEVALVLGTREGESVRGGNLNTLGAATASSQKQAHELIDAAIQATAQRAQVSVTLPQAGSSGGGGVVDSAALSAYAASVTGPSGVLAQTARLILSQLGLTNEAAPALAENDTDLVNAVEAELGPDWLKSVQPVFDPRQAVLFDDRWASAREELARAATQSQAVKPARFTGAGETVARQARWWAEQLTDDAIANSFRKAAEAALTSTNGIYQDEIALVTGAAPGSIATALVERLLAGGALVIMTASRVNPARIDFARKLYAEHAAAGAALWLVPANLSSYRDVDDLIDWIASAQVETKGDATTIIKPALTPTLAFPFAAGPVSGSVADAGGKAEAQSRLLLWSVERMIARLSETAEAASADARVHVVLPGSPNRGTFGGDGAYGEVKAAFDAICNKWSVEAGWPETITLAHPQIGWVAGTHLMGGNDALVPAARAAGIEVFTPSEISTKLLSLCSPEARKQAQEGPLKLDLSGGLATSQISLPNLAAQVTAEGSLSSPTSTVGESAPVGAATGALVPPATIGALPSPRQCEIATGTRLREVTADLSELVVIVGTGEVSAWGSGRTRSEAEYGLSRDGSVDLTAAGVLELAWMMNLVHWSEDPAPGWYDQSGTPVPEAEIFDRYRDEVVARCGIRTLVDDSNLVEQGSIDVATVYLDRDIEFSVASEAEARDYLLADPASTKIRAGDDGEWLVTKAAGAITRVPKKATLSRTVGGQLPTDFDPARWGISAALLDGLDRIAVWNLVTSVDAFLSSGFTPAELLQAIHPTEVACTQGTGIGGMESLRKVFLDRFLGEERPQDILQEALPNVVAAHVMQSYVGGYGAMIHPVAACATAAVSVEEGVDKIRVGKAQFVVAGGIDDLGVESLTGFGDMNATANSAEMAAKGIPERFFSRANDRRRGGFVEAAGGGTVLLARGDVAAQMGLPVLAVVAHAQSYADGSHTSIPAPGIGALAAARGGQASTLARSLQGLGLTADDVRVVSKHDTSTNANDPNETELHARLWGALGRQPGNPLFVVSQKTVTGHAKGGAALFQIAGLTEIMRNGRIPGNLALDCVAPEIAASGGDFVWLREPLELGAGKIKAAVLSSLGFGHVSAVIVLAHPDCFVAALEAAGGSATEWRDRANQRLQAGVQRLEGGMVGAAKLFEPTSQRRLPTEGAHESEIAMLLDDEVRLGAEGFFPRADS